nr:reverse transcriptase domain-containing protein [Tanacetum cinerariifolium]
MANQRTMAQLLQAPTEAYEDAIVVPAITADNFELKHGLLTLVQNKQFFRHDKEDPRAHVRYFNKITSTLKFPNVLNTSIKLMLLPFSLEGAARIWLEKEPPRSDFTWDDLVSKFINKFFPPSKTTNLRNEITNFQQRFDESFKDEPEATKDTVNPTNNKSTKDVQPQVFQYESLILTSESVTSPISEPVIALIFKDMSFEISFAYALILMPKFASTLKALIGIKEKLSEMARTPLNEHCSAVLLKKLPKKLGYPGKFLIPCDFPCMVECLALADLGASINLMPFSVWKRLYLPVLTPMCMTLELADRSISCLVGVAEDVYVKVGSFYFSTDFVVIDFDADPRVPLILERSFLKTERALIDVFEGELTLRVGKEAIAFNLDQTSSYLANYSDMMAKRIDNFISLISTLRGGILLLEAFLNDDPSLPPPNQGNYLPKVHKELKICEAKSDKSSIDKPSEVELKDLPPHLEYAFLE